MPKPVLTLIVCLILSSFLPLSAQVFPGDSNDDGEVNHYDILYTTYAYGTVGPSRLIETTTFNEQSIPVLWQEQFPDGTNYAFADGNGNGLVEWGDLSATFFNYGQQHGIPDPITFPNPVIGQSVELKFQPPAGNPMYSSGMEIELPVLMGSPVIPVSDFQGIAFSVHFDDDFIETAQFEPISPWLGPEEVFYFQNQVSAEPGELDVALSHYGQSSGSNGFGQLGTFRFIVEDVLVDLLQGADSVDIVFSFEGIMFVDTSFNLKAVANDSISLRIYSQDVVASSERVWSEQEFRLFPNPSRGQFALQAPMEIERLSIYNLLGQPLWHSLEPRSNSLEVSFSALGFAPGTYLLEVEAGEGVFRRKVIYLP